MRRPLVFLATSSYPRAVLAAVREVLEAEPLLRVDYAELVDPDTLAPVDVVEGRVLLLVAVHCGETRLIDNALLEVSA